MIREHFDRMFTLDRYEQFGIRSVINIEKGFNLWCSYMDRASVLLSHIENPVLTVRYEDLLEAPEKHLKEMTEFCGLPVVSSDRMESCTRYIKSTNAYRFKEDKELAEIYEIHKENLWFKEFGYDNIS